jgi:HPt (histidine-containing phosphotransfer) domain-containing protein
MISSARGAAVWITAACGRGSDLGYASGVAWFAGGARLRLLGGFMSASDPPAPPARLISQLLQEDAELRDIVEEFVAGLDTRLGELRDAHAKLDFAMLSTLAHRLKGAAGSYGYPDISRVCADMEHKFRTHQAGDFAGFVAELTDYAAAAKAGLVEPT